VRTTEPQGVMTQTVDAPVIAEPDLDELLTHEDLWAVIAWNDDVTTFDTVIKAFVEIFGHTPDRAERLAWKIHRTGKATVAVRPKDEAEAGARALHDRKISATIARA
jgi:ATP-dependent Clp protease adapter protein ClpS